MVLENCGRPLKKGIEDVSKISAVSSAVNSVTVAVVMTAVAMAVAAIAVTVAVVVTVVVDANELAAFGVAEEVNLSDEFISKSCFDRRIIDSDWHSFGEF